MDMSAKQRLCYQRRPLNLNLSVAVLRHVISTVRQRKLGHMTLILTVGTDRRVIQASDRLVTLPDGTVYNDKANKSVAVTCEGGQCSISFTGAAYIAGKKTDEWIGNYLTDIHAATLDTKTIWNSLIKQLANFQKFFSVPYLSLVFCGYIGERPYIALMSNFEHWNPNKFVAPTPDFHLEVIFMKEVTNPKKALALCINGCEKAITETIEHKLKRLRKKRFFQNNDSNTVALKLVALIREASRTQEHGKYIGRDCLTVSISRNPSDDTELIYHPEKESPKRYGPYIVHPTGSIKGIEIEGDMEVKFFPGDG